MKQKRYLIPAVQEGLLLILLSGWLLWYSLDAYNHSYIKDWAQSPSLFPVLVACLLALFGVIILRQGLAVEYAASAGHGAQPLQALILLGMALAYYLALSVVKMPYLAATLFGLTFSVSTFEVVTVVYLLVMMFYLGVRNKAVLALVPVSASLVLSVIFRTMLRVLLP